ncbi:MAG: hypothetical protein CMJ67_10190 [Planctomycetaceae bacterium]|nr:hypothetical protein [Planctomycetaceae bacterium]
MKPVTLAPGIGDNAPTAALYYGQDVRDSLRLLSDASVHTVCTSPPYFGLRDYGKDGQIGLEPTPDEFVESLVEVFREIKRVLRPDGTLWVNLGDSYNNRSVARPSSHQGGLGFKNDSIQTSWADHTKGGRTRLSLRTEGFKEKDILGIPWRMAFALQQDGWYLRQDIVWHKPFCMPESVRDRCTKSHEYVFLLAHPDSGGRYYYDADAIRRPTGNKRSVWSVNPKPYRGAHFACWPPDLVRPMILAGCPVGGTVLDPFSGSATTGMVALQEARNYVGIDLNSDYLGLAQARIEGRKAPQPVEPDSERDIFDLFGG